MNFREATDRLKDLGVTQDDIAGALGISPATVRAARPGSGRELEGQLPATAGRMETRPHSACQGKGREAVRRGG